MDPFQLEKNQVCKKTKLHSRTLGGVTILYYLTFFVLCALVITHFVYTQKQLSELRTMVGKCIMKGDDFHMSKTISEAPSNGNEENTYMTTIHQREKRGASRRRDRKRNGRSSIFVAVDNEELQANDTENDGHMKHVHNNEGKIAALHLTADLDEEKWEVAMKMDENDSHILGDHGILARNGYTSHDKMYSFWHPRHYTKGYKRHFRLNKKGIVKIKEEGLYFIYVQIHYHDSFHRWSAAVFVDDERFIQCAGDDIPKNHDITITSMEQCYTAAVRYLKEGQMVHVAELYPERKIVLLPHSTFWGLVKLA